MCTRTAGGGPDACAPAISCIQGTLVFTYARARAAAVASAQGGTALHMAVGKGKLDVVRVLLDRGAKVGATNEVRAPACMHAHSPRAR